MDRKIKTKKEGNSSLFFFLAFILFQKQYHVNCNAQKNPITEAINIFRSDGTSFGATKKVRESKWMSDRRVD